MGGYLTKNGGQTRFLRSSFAWPADSGGRGFSHKFSYPVSELVYSMQTAEPVIIIIIIITTFKNTIVIV